MLFCVMGSGYVGTALLTYPKPFSCYATTTSKEKLERLEQIAQKACLFSTEDPSKLSSILEECDGLILLIAPKKNSSYEKTYLETARAIFSTLQTRKRPFYLIYTSSVSVYEKNSPTAKILLETEKTLLACKSALIQVAILRLGGIYGPGRELEKRALQLSGKMLEGTGEEPTNHIHLDDILKALCFCIQKRLEGIFDLVAQDHPTRKELYETLCSKLKVPPPLWSQRPGLNKPKLSSKIFCEQGFVFTHPHLFLKAL